MNDILRKYEGRLIDLNWDEPAKFKEATPQSCSETSFTIQLPKSDVRVHYPLSQVMQVIKAPEGNSLSTSGVWSGKPVPLLVQMIG
jgi:hypothetical protein